jgi:hypothetical protein
MKNKQIEWTQERRDWLRHMAKVRPLSQLPERFTQTFGLPITESAIKGACARYGISTGRTGQFKKGNKSWNEGTKGVMKANGTTFKKGQTPHNEKPLGAERKTKDGIIEVKIKMVGKSCERWQSKHSLLWEQRTGRKVPEGHVVMFADGNRLNYDQANLRLVSRRVNVTHNSRGYSHQPTEVRPALLAVAQLDIAIKETQEAL